MKKIIFVFLTVLIVSTVILSCSKNNDTTVASNFSYVTAKPWLYEHEWKKIAVDSPWILIDTTLPVCLKDVITTFTTDYRFGINAGKINCDTTKYAPTLLVSGTWSLQNNQTTLVTGSALGSTTYAIEVLNNTNLQLSYQDSTGFYRELYSH